jgi:hypothetical protein
MVMYIARVVKCARAEGLDLVLFWYAMCSSGTGLEWILFFLSVWAG